MKKPTQTVPQIRFPEFSDKWELTCLSEILEESKVKNKDLKYSKTDVLSVSGDYGVVNQIEHLGRSYAGASVHNYGIVEVGDIVYTKSPLKDNPYGIIKVNKNKPGIVSTLYAIYKTKNDKLDVCFIDYYFSLEDNTNRYLRPLVRKGAKNDMKINNDYVLSESIYIPQNKEQIKISQFLELFDEKLILLNTKLNDLIEYKKGLLQNIFSQVVRFKNDEGRQFPNWEELPAGKVFKSVSNKEHNGDLTVLAATQENGMVPRASIGIEIKSSAKSIKSYKIVEKGDFVISLRSFQGGIEYSNYYGICSPAYTILKPKIKINHIFFKFYFKKESFIERLSKTVVGIRDGKQISYSAFAGLKLQLPSFEEQCRIADLITNIDFQIKNAEAQLNNTKEYKKALLQKMFCN